MVVSGSGVPGDAPAQPTDAAHGRGPTEIVARVLAAVGGYVDAVGYVALFQLFTAHQSGNSAGLGAALGTSDWTEAWRRGLAIGAYVAGIALGTLIVEVGRLRGLRSTGAVVAAAELATLGAALGVGEASARAGLLVPAHTAVYAIAAACLAGGMGLQTVALRRVGRRTVRTTFVTGVLTTMAESLVVAWFQADRRRRQRLLSVSRLLGSIWVLYLGGAVAGALAERSWSFAALVLPIAAVGTVAVWQFRSGYQPSLPERGLDE